VISEPLWRRRTKSFRDACVRRQTPISAAAEAFAITPPVVHAPTHGSTHVERDERQRHQQQDGRDCRKHLGPVDCACADGRGCDQVRRILRRHRHPDQAAGKRAGQQRERGRESCGRQLEITAGAQQHEAERQEVKQLQADLRQQKRIADQQPHFLADD
jgi:hypothetical protein